MRPRGLKCVFFCRLDTGVVGSNPVRSIVPFVFVGVLLYRYRFCEGLIPLTVIYTCLINYLYAYKMGGRGPNLLAGACEWAGMRSGATKVAVSRRNN